MARQATETDVSSSDVQGRQPSKPSKKQANLNQNASTAENKNLQAVIANLQKQNLELQQKQALKDKTNQRLQENYVEEYSHAHNGHQLSDVESEDNDTSGTLEFSSSLLPKIWSKGIISTPPRRLHRKGLPRITASSPTPDLPGPDISHIDFRSSPICRISNQQSSPLPSDSDSPSDANNDAAFNSVDEAATAQHNEPPKDPNPLTSGDPAQVAGSKQPHSPLAPQSDLPSDAKKPHTAKVANGTKGVNQRDYDGKACQILYHICKEWEQRIYTVNRYPDTEVERTWLQELWGEACEEFGEVYELTKVMQTMIKRRSARVRGAMKTDMKSLVVATYGFVVSSKKAMIEQNKKKYVMLATHGAFTCKEPKALRCRFENKIIPLVITEHFFGHCKAPGIIWEDDFDCVKPEMVALVVTILEHCIEEWADGTFMAQKLNDTTQTSHYLAHLKDVKAWCSGDVKVTGNIRRLWATKGRTHADVQPKQIGDGFIDDPEKERLIADLQGRTGETDSEVETDEEEGHDAMVGEE